MHQHRPSPTHVTKENRTNQNTSNICCFQCFVAKAVSGIPSIGKYNDTISEQLSRDFL